MRTSFICLLLFTTLLTSCERIALLTTPKKQPIVSQSSLAKQAENYFWETLHHGHYDQIPLATQLLTAAYLQNPNDPKLAAHLGFIHIWKITERERKKNIEPTIVDEIIIATKYFQDAVILNPQDARILGFLGDSNLIAGQIFKDPHQEIRGYYQLKKAIAKWPQFNYFTSGYPMSTLPANSRLFIEALNWQWQTLDLCAGTKIDRKNPDYRPYLSRETQQGLSRVCWNSWIAPHNFEGFFLNMGDMLVKSGDWQTAIKIYANAKLSKTYSIWPYRTLLENRINNAKNNVTHFQREINHSPNTTILFNSGYGCMACHQAT